MDQLASACDILLPTRLMDLKALALIVGFLGLLTF
jgi:hypothetical protein